MIGVKRYGWLACLLLLAGSEAARAEMPEYRRDSDVIYGRKAGLALTMDVFAPKKSNGCGIIYVVSGGWISWPAMIHPSFFQEYLSRGYTVFAVVHSSQPKFTIPEIISDMHRAVRYVRAHAADYHLDPDRIGVTGSSSGGHLALMLGSDGQKGNPKAKDPVDQVSSRVQAVACFFPPTDFLNWGEKGKQVDVTNTPAPFTAAVDFHELNRRKARYEAVVDEQKLRKILEEISPICHVDAEDAPTLIFHGDKDPLVPLQQSESYVAKLKDCGVSAKLVVKKGYRHGWLTIQDDVKVCADWFDQHLQRRSDRDHTASSPTTREKAAPQNR